MTTQQAFYLALGGFAGGFINGLSGTGTALFALGFFLVVLPPLHAVAIVAVISVVAGLQGVWLVRREIAKQPARLARFALPGLVGVPLGMSLLAVVDTGMLRLSIAALLILYGGYFGFRARLPAISRDTHGLDMGIGLIGGVMGGAAALSGALTSIWLSMRDWSKSETRAVLQPYNVIILLSTILLLIWQGAFNQTTLLALAVAMPVALIAAQLGIEVFKRLTSTQFRRLLILLCLAMGLGILMGEVT